MSSRNPWDDDSSTKARGNSSDFFKEMKSEFSNLPGGNFFKKGEMKGVLVGVIAFYLLSGICQIQHDECGVVLRFGKWVRTVGPGLQYVLPYPFEDVLYQRVTRVNQIDISNSNHHNEESLMLTGDSNLANISFSVLWKIRREAVEDFLFNAKRPEITVRAVAESVMRDIVGQNLFTYVQTEGRADIQNKAKASLQAIMDEYKMGIEIVRVELQRVEPPSSVIDSFRDVERAQAEQQSEKNKAEAYDRDTRARTRGLVAEKLNRGEAQKQSIIAKAKGDVARFLSTYSQYKLAPDIVSKRLYLDTMRDVYKNVNKIIVDSDVKAIPHLPLTEISKKPKEIAQ